MPDCTKDTEKCKYLEKLNRKVTKEMKELVKSEKGQVRIRVDDKNDLFEVTLPNSFFEIILGEKLETIGTSAFANCVALAKVNLPARVNSFDISAFTGCKALKKIAKLQEVVKVCDEKLKEEK